MGLLEPASAVQSLRLDILGSPYEPLDQLNDEVDQDSFQGDSTLNEEDVHSVIGVSISRAQTRLMSPRTQRAEDVITLESRGIDGFFDAPKDGSPPESSALDPQEGRALSEPSAITEESEAVRRHAGTSVLSLPSPWTASPKHYSMANPGSQENVVPRARASAGPTGMLADLNLKRFLPSLHVLSLPRGMSLKDFSVPAVSSIFSGSKDSSQSQGAQNRPKRASTLFSLSPSVTGGVQERKWAHETNDEAIACQVPGCSTVHEPARRPLVSNGKDSSKVSIERRGLVLQSPSRGTSLRRVQSDQSLILRHTTSLGSTLGDDSRWEHVQDQVNSRFKAVVDSLQDSTIKLPSLPSLPSINFNSLRPDFMRNRAWSDLRKPTSVGEGILNVATKHSGRGEGVSQTCVPNGSGSHGSVANQKSPKPSISQLNQALEQLTGDIVIMGGYRGSVLRSAKPPHRQLWVPVKVGLNIRKVNLEVGLTLEDEENMEKSIIPSGMLSHIGPVDMGRRLLKRLRGCPNVQGGKLRVHDYGYDWRLSPHLLSRKLIAFLERLPSNAQGVPKKDRGATVIAHSLGGLITRHAVNQRPELFASVVYAGTPQHCINILGPLRKGDDVLLSSRVLTPQVNFTLRTSFLLLPDDGKCFIDKHTKDEYPVDFFNVEDWKVHAFSPCIAPTLAAANQPEKKGILETVSDNLPSLPLPMKRVSLPFNSSRDHYKELLEQTGTAASNAAAKLDDIAHPVSRAFDPQITASTRTASAATHCTIPLPAAISYLTRTLASTLAFKQELAFQPSLSAQNKYPPLSILYSTSVPTVLAARVSSRDAIRRADAYDDLAFGSGDGVCLAKAAMLPVGYECTRGGRVRTERGHVGLLGDLEAVGRCLIAVREARRRGVGCKD